MKLNLLPTSASKGKGLGFATFIAVLLVVLSAGAAFVMGQQSKQKIEYWTNKATEVKPAYDAAVTVSALAEDVVTKSKGVILNAALAKEMIAHNSAYPAFYDKLSPS